MTAPLPQPVPVPGPEAPRKGNGLAVAGFVLGLVGLLGSFVPVLNIPAIVIAVVGLVLGILGIVSARRSGTGKGLAVSGVVLAGLAIVVGIIVTVAFAETVSDAADELDDVPVAVEDPVEGGGGSASADETERGTRENPFAIGETVATDDWKVTLGEPREAWTEIQAENEFNEPPAEGSEFWIVPVTAEYLGDSSGTPWVELMVHFVGNDAVTYDDTYCGVIPDDLSDVGELYPGGVADGNVCVVVPEGAPGLFALTADLFGDPVFFKKG